MWLVLSVQLFCNMGFFYKCKKDTFLHPAPRTKVSLSSGPSQDAFHNYTEASCGGPLDKDTFVLGADIFFLTFFPDFKNLSKKTLNF
jgi:hypothetical protein